MRVCEMFDYKAILTNLSDDRIMEDDMMEGLQGRVQTRKEKLTRRMEIGDRAEEGRGIFIFMTGLGLGWAFLPRE